MQTNNQSRRRRKRGRTHAFGMGSLATRGLVSSAVDRAARPTPNNSLIQPRRAVVRMRPGQSERIGHE